MQALQVVKFSSDYKESLKYGDFEKPIIKSPHEVLVRVKAASINPAEAKMASGNIPGINLMVSLPAVYGGDFAGIIEQIGTQVKDFNVGDEVYGSLPMPFGLKGSFAQYTIVDTKKASIAKKPSGLSFESASTAGIAFLTAYQGVFVNAHFLDKQQQKTILVIGASGGVGGYAVQIAKRAIDPETTTVIGICSSKNAEYVRSLGADKVVNYDKKEEYEVFLKDAVGSIDLVFDTVGGEDYHHQMDPLLKKNGVYSSAVGPLKHAGSESTGVLAMVGMVAKVAATKLFGKHKYSLISGLPHQKFRTEVAPLFESDMIKKEVSEENIFPLSEGYEAFEKIMTHRVVGKIVFRVD